MGVCLGIYFNVFILSHAFGFDSLVSLSASSPNEILKSKISFYSSPRQLSFKVGDVIYLHDRREDWFYGELEGRRGIFPKRYVKVLVPLPPSQPLQGLPLTTIIANAPQCVALYDFDDLTNSQANDSGSRDKCLKFKAVSRMSYGSC
jgi:hypothetical protein